MLKVSFISVVNSSIHYLVIEMVDMKFCKNKRVYVTFTQKNLIQSIRQTCNMMMLNDVDELMMALLMKIQPTPREKHRQRHYALRDGRGSFFSHGAGPGKAKNLQSEAGRSKSAGRDGAGNILRTSSD